MEDWPFPGESATLPAMSSQPTKLLHSNLIRWTVPLVAPLLVAVHVFLAPALQHTPPGQIADLTLRLAALLTVPLPLLVLQLVTTPPQLATRRLLGETAHATLRTSLRDVLLWTVLLLTVPVALALDGLWLGAPVLLHVAAVLAGVAPLTAGLAVAAMLHGLRLLAGGKHAGWTAVSGGGAFGPAESAPLLYLPAFALVGALAPVAFLTAVWNARPEWLTPTVWRLLPVIGVLLGARLATVAFRRARPWLHAGLRAAEQAHASRFAQSDGLDEPPAWLTLGQSTDAQRFLARAWHRRWPLAGIATLALALVTTLLVRADASHWALATCAFGFAAVAHLRTRALIAEPAWASSQWLGLPESARWAALRRLALGLTLPAVALFALFAWRGNGLDAAIGLPLGVAAAAWLLRGRAISPLASRIAWLIYAVGLAAAATGAL